MPMTRRALMGVTAAGAAVAAVPALVLAEETMFGLISSSRSTKGTFPVQKTAAEWREILTPEQYYVLREHGTERAFTSPLNDEKRAGVFHCAGCDQALYSSEHKFDSGTGWPSFWQPITPEAIGTSEDRKLIYVRTEVHCSNCGGHQGHVFEDGPPPTGLRHCINGVALTFRPAATG